MKVIIKVELENGTPVCQMEVDADDGKEGGVVRLLSEMVEDVGGEIV